MGLVHFFPSSSLFIVDPEPVGKLNCMLVIKKPELYLNWSSPAGRFDNVSIKICSGNWTKVNYCTPEQRTITLTNLNYFTNYNISIVTYSFAMESVPQEVTCLTSIGGMHKVSDLNLLGAKKTSSWGEDNLCILEPLASHVNSTVCT